tara:strand:+ start:6091 stop:6315 length:225 start_codon:yes stop_codon:yes gene_type:complete
MDAKTIAENARTICNVLPVSRVRAPTKVIPLIALAPDIKGVCKVLGIFDINSNPKKIAKTSIKNKSKNISIKIP